MNIRMRLGELIADRGPRTSISDAAIAHKLGKKTVYFTGMMGMVGQQCTNGQPVYQTMLGTGINSRVADEAYQAACEIAAPAMDSGDEIYHFIPNDLFWDADFTRDIQAKVIYNVNTTGSAAFEVDLKGIAFNEAPSDAAVSPSSNFVLTTPTGGRVTVATALTQTDWGGLTGVGLQNLFGTDIGWLMRVRALGFVTATQCRPWCMVFRYTRQICTTTGLKEYT